jgi:hypothetical protein
VHNFTDIIKCRLVIKGYLNREISNKFFNIYNIYKDHRSKGRTEGHVGNSLRDVVLGIVVLTLVVFTGIVAAQDLDDNYVFEKEEKI